jgi:hypothetical protein
MRVVDIALRQTTPRPLVASSTHYGWLLELIIMKFLGGQRYDERPSAEDRQQSITERRNTLQQISYFPSLCPLDLNFSSRAVLL